MARQRDKQRDPPRCKDGTAKTANHDVHLYCLPLPEAGRFYAML